MIGGAPIVWRAIQGMMRGHFAADLVASLAIITAVLLAQPIAGLVVVLMQTGGEALERYAAGRASSAVRQLEDAAPRRAHVQRGETFLDVDAADVVVGDTVLVRPGELVPCDGVVLSGESHVDTASITGESIPVVATRGIALPSGTRNLDGPLQLRATKLAGESQYARIIDLVRSAQESKAPLQRLADRYAVWFTPFTIAVCAVTYLVTRDTMRVLSVLVVATPCPLLLATPIAIIGGISRAARKGIIVRHGAAMERLGTITVAAFDKTGTITMGRPEVSRIGVMPGIDEHELLRLAAAVEHGSGHLLARMLVEHAQASGVEPTDAQNLRESPGRGIAGLVEGKSVLVGAQSFATGGDASLAGAVKQISSDDGALGAYVSVDGQLWGVVEYADAIRTDAPDVVLALDKLGVSRVMMLSGDRQATAERIAAAAGIGEVHAELLPEAKVTIVKRLVAEGESVLMVGDGTNDAPALAAATVGIALAGHSGSVTAEAADVVILSDQLSRVPESVALSRSTVGIARQSIYAGLGLSAIAMGFAAAGHVPPTVGALLQEGIDVAVILNALRASRDRRATAGGNAGHHRGRVRLRRRPFFRPRV